MNEQTIPGFPGIEGSSERQTSMEASLEGRFIEEYLLSKGYRITDLHSLPKEEALALRIEACRYATLKLAEIEARSRFRKAINLPD